jgi:hydrogenase maturation protease
VRTLVIGVGNPLLADDGVGPAVARALRSVLAERSEVRIEEEYRGGLRLMERMIGFERVIVVDAMLGGTEPGTIRRLTPAALAARHVNGPHDAGLAEALEIGRAIGAPLPPEGQLFIVAVEAADVGSFSECCTPAVARAVPRAVESVLRLLGEGSDAQAEASTRAHSCSRPRTTRRPASGPRVSVTTVACPSRPSRS